MVSKIKRGRGRPTAEMSQIYAMIEAEAKVKELFADKYVAAAQYIVDLIDDSNAPKNLKFQAAKTIKEQVETWMEEHFEENTDEEPEDNIPVKIRI